YSWGSYSIVAFASPYFSFLCAALLILRRGKYMDRKVRRAIGLSMLFLVTLAILQGMYPEILMSSLGLMMINVALFYTVESPDALMIEKLAEERKNAESANRAKSLFLAQMSHEIRTPINAVLGMNEMILRETDNEDIRDYSATIKEAGKTLLSLINSILDFSKIEDNKMELLSVEYETAELINNIVNSIYNRARSKGLYLEINVDEKLPSKLIGDDIRLTQVIMNLLTNAVKYTEKGTVSFSMILEKTEGDTVTIGVSVKDTGIGIKASEISELFNSFIRLDEKRNRNIEGTGLGMAIVDRLLKMMGSTIQIESTYGKGSTFSFHIEQKISDAKPVGDYKLNLAQSRKIETGDVAFKAAGANVLIVDDNSMNHKVAKNLLKLFGIVPDMAMSGAEAIQMVKDKTYHIICLDHMMPELDGIETLERMRTEKLIPDTTVVLAMTANAVVGAKEMYLEKGFDDYISKPIALEELAEKLKKYLPEADSISSAPEYSAADVLEFAPSDDEDNVSADTANSSDEIIVQLENLGINVAGGLLHCANEQDFYFDVIRDYYTSAQEKLTQLDGFLHTNALNEYEILVHAVKSMSRTIGADAVADMALALEQGAGRRDKEYVIKNHPAFAKAYKEMSENLQQLLYT
nr:response regulator [Acetatifactor sp.]